MTKQSKRAPTFQAVALAALAPGGIENVEAMTPPPSKRTLGLAAADLQARGADVVAALVSVLRVERFPPQPRLGRPLPKPGSVEEYTVQQDKRGSEFVRIPPHVLGRSKGQKVMARFEDGKIELTPGTE